MRRPLRPSDVVHAYRQFAEVQARTAFFRWRVARRVGNEESVPFAYAVWSSPKIFLRTRLRAGAENALAFDMHFARIPRRLAWKFAMRSLLSPKAIAGFGMPHFASFVASRKGLPCTPFLDRGQYSLNQCRFSLRNVRLPEGPMTLCRRVAEHAAARWKTSLQLRRGPTL